MKEFTFKEVSVNHLNGDWTNGAIVGIAVGSVIGAGNYFDLTPIILR
ncbi:hypothetical protein K1728_12080 (plasmid) [Weissella confusa]|nr:hypothetical protein [Weissella confusa]QYU59001.1 hypothetical protein K1728_12080 [Weissella confusa]